VLHILLDEGISRAVARELQASGYVVEHALDLHLKGQPDPIIFHAAQQRAAALCTLNRADYLLLAIAWTAWGLGPHSGLLTPRPGRQPKPAVIVQSLRALCDKLSTLQGQIIYL
jgi:predicted nuclease of predicted toxin-antitoxin system